MLEILTIMGQYGVPAVIAGYLVWWLTKRFEVLLIELKKSHKNSMIGIQKAIASQTKVLNHTLTELINKVNNGIDKQVETHKLIKNKAKKCK